ncbi:sarcosine oxidase subunit delta [Methylobacterium oryzihabitans]|uniref:Sarcosine oxidase subunit delta n=1 Tax=Methylobacterium oryzihabitans TaxID=2499852 RepID=A0A3S2VEQ9_9HYPH|nr:sarcosine oxidase subunit delta [Methylobacterium oryzihabitans]RVU21220.1 sarcosine oxidase subunit delta [Methylobacterium oryzihabitans]
MRIRCPYCGERDNGEFSYRGDAAPRIAGGDAATPEALHDAVYLRDNPAGPIDELWFHAAGCRAWLVVTRDTRTHAIASVAPARAVARARQTGDAP